MQYKKTKGAEEGQYETHCFRECEYGGGPGSKTALKRDASLEAGIELWRRSGVANLKARSGNGRWQVDRMKLQQAKRCGRTAKNGLMLQYRSQCETKCCYGAGRGLSAVLKRETEAE